MPRRATDPEGALVTALAEMQGAELSSMLLDVADARVAERAPSRVLRQYESDRFVRPSRVDPRVRLEVERACFESASAFEPIELSPLAAFGTCASVATVSQKKIVTTMRGSEVASDPSNTLALECASRLKRRGSRETIKLCASQRVVRAQALARPEHTAHFLIFVTAVAGRDPGGRVFQEQAIAEHLEVQLRLLEALAERGHPTRDVSVMLSPDAKHTEAAARVAARLVLARPSLPVDIDPEREAKSGYYHGLCFSLYVAHEGARIPLGDGGLVPWLATLTGDRKERYAVGAIGAEVLASFLAPR